MILLSIAVCLVASGPCFNLKADQTFPSYEACEIEGQKELAMLMRQLDGERYTPGAIACSAVPEDEAG